MEFNKVEVATETVSKLEKENDSFKVTTDKGNYDTRTVIIATGSSARKINVPGEKEFANKGVTYCSVCDGPLFNDMDVAIIGGGNSALEAIDFLKDIASRIHAIVLEDRFSGHEYLIEQVHNNPKVEVHFNAKTTEILGDKFVTGLKYEQDGKIKEISVRGVIIEIGRIPNTDIFQDFVKLDQHKHIIIDCQGRTNVEGVFGAGDCASGHEYQYIIAGGQGCIALLKAARYLATKKWS
jgi:thioredoxin reductase